MKRIYLSGPMTGLPDSNYPAFHYEAARIRRLGYHVENPAENAPPRDGSWSGYMRAALTQMLTCDVIALLPGWMESRGATIERGLAVRLGMEALPVGEIKYQVARPIDLSPCWACEGSGKFLGEQCAVCAGDNHGDAKARA